MRSESALGDISPLSVSEVRYPDRWEHLEIKLAI